MSDDCYTARVMPILPLDHPEPFAATLGVMLYPGEDEASQRRTRAFTAQHLAEPLRVFHDAGHSSAYRELARITSDAGVALDDLDKRRWEGSVCARRLCGHLHRHPVEAGFIAQRSSYRAP